MRKHLLEFPGILPHFQPVVEQVRNFEPDFEAICDFLFFAALPVAQPGIRGHGSGAVFTFSDQFSGKRCSKAIRNLAILPVERVNSLQRRQRGIKVAKLQKPFRMQFAVILCCRLVSLSLLIRIFHPLAGIAQDAGDIGKARLVIMV